MYGQFISLILARPEILHARPEILPAHPEILPAHPEILPAHPEILPAHPEIPHARPEILHARPEILHVARPEIVVQPSSVTLHEGDTLLLECQAECRPGPPQYLWFWKTEYNLDPRFGPLPISQPKKWEPVKNSNTNWSI